MERTELIRLLGMGDALAKPEPLRCVEERDPARFIDACRRAMAEASTVVVCDPAWAQRERTQLAALLAGQGAGLGHAGGWLLLPTGGSSGQLKLARHDQDTMTAAVRGFCAHFGVSRVDAVGVLPLCHTSGFMAWMRCAMTGGNYLPWSWKQLEAGEMPEWPGGGFLSLVPTQLQRLLGQPRAVDWLKKFRAVFVGGGPAWPDLLEAAAAVRVPISPCYGMTETAAMVAALLPEDFLAGARSCGTVLPHARVEIVEDSVVRIGGGSVFRGYYPAWRAEPMFETEDIGQIDSRDHLHIAGRRDAVIVTGGKKVAPEEVEAALRATGRFADVAVVGVPDAEWGQCVVACYPAGNGPAQLDEVRAALSERLAAYKCPKRYAPLSLWPRNAQGKIDRAALARLLAVQI